MAEEIIQLDAMELTGPRSFFTDLDPKDADYNSQAVALKLKLQLLTKEKIVIAASSLFTDSGCELFSSEQGFIDAIEQGIIIPAIRNEFASPKDFFQQYKHAACSISTRNFFIQHAKHSVPWDLKSNSSWFQKTFFEHLADPHSLLRQKTLITESAVNNFLGLLDLEIQKNQDDQKYLRREHVFSVAKQFGEEVSSYVNNYANLLYRISGSMAVKCDSHFPQANLTKLGLTDNDKIISDERIFWDIYIETVISFLNSAIRLTPERLETLSVRDILKIRKALVSMTFSREYDILIKKAKEKVDIYDPFQMILKQSEINACVQSLRAIFAEQLIDELQMKDTAVREKSLWQVGNALALFPMPAIGVIIGVLSSFGSIPEITALVSKSLSETIRQRYEWVRNFINCKIGWSKEQRKTLIDGYRELVNYGLPQ